MSLSRNELLALGAVGALVLVAVLGSRAGRELAVGSGKTAGRFVGNVATGAVIGLGEVAGLPDTTDAQTIGEGRAALASGAYLEASTKLPAVEFLNGLGSKFGLWLYGVTHPNEDADLGLRPRVSTDYSVR